MATGIPGAQEMNNMMMPHGKMPNNSGTRPKHAALEQMATGSWFPAAFPWKKNTCRIFKRFIRQGPDVVNGSNPALQKIIKSALQQIRRSGCYLIREHSPMH